MRAEARSGFTVLTVGWWRWGALLDLHTVGHHLAALLLETHLFVALPAGVGLLLNQELLKGEELHLLSIHIRIKICSNPHTVRPGKTGLSESRSYFSLLNKTL